jgi:hypothetical protein
MIRTVAPRMDLDRFEEDESQFVIDFLDETFMLEASHPDLG